MADAFNTIRTQIINDPMNAAMKAKGYEPVYTAGAGAKIVVIGQAPGRKAQESGIPWHDVSGEMLRAWMGVSDEQFYDSDIVALLPMDFYYPGKGVHGDLPPRKEFATTWHAKLLENMPNVELMILIGAYSQKYYLGKNAGRNLTETVFHYADYLPTYFPLVHPSPLNFRWQAKNPWFKADVVPALRETIAKILK